MSFFTPDVILDTFDCLTVEECQKRGIKTLLLDVDNTLAPYEEETPNDRVLAWITAMREAGITLAFISNNNGKRLTLFNQTLGCPCYFNAKKPFARMLRRAMKDLKADAASTAMMGDQVFTDVWAGKNCGLRTYLVPPIKDKKNLFFRTKRLLERPVVRSYYRKKHRGQENEK